MDFINDLDSEDPCRLGLFGGGKHFADIPEGRHGANQRSQRLVMQQSANDMIPHNDMLEHAIYKGPTPSSTIRYIIKIPSHCYSLHSYYHPHLHNAAGQLVLTLFCFLD